MHRTIALPVIALAAIASLAACKTTNDSTTSSSGSSASSSAPAKLGPLAHAADVHIDACTYDSTLQTPVAHLTVTNNSSKPSDYSVSVAFESGTTTLDTGEAFIHALQPGQSTKEDALSLKQGLPSSGYTCKLVTADRFSAVG